MFLLQQKIKKLNEGFLSKAVKHSFKTQQYRISEFYKNIFITLLESLYVIVQI